MFCKICGATLDDGEICLGCAEKKEAISLPSSSVVALNNGSPPASPGENQKESFTQRLYNFGSGQLFLIGFAMYAATRLISILANFNAFSIFPLAYAALPIVGMGLIYTTSKNPTEPEKVLTAMTLFKTTAIIGLVLFCLLMGGAILMLLGLGAIVALESPGDGGPILIAFVLVVVFIVVVIVFYYVALLRVIKGIRTNFENNSFAPIRGVAPFTLMAGWSAGFGILANLLIFIGVDFFNDLLSWFTGYLSDLVAVEGGNLYMNGDLFAFDNLLDDLSLPGVAQMRFGAVFGILSSAAIVVLLVVLNKFCTGKKRLG